MGAVSSPSHQIGALYRHHSHIRDFIGLVKWVPSRKADQFPLSSRDSSLQYNGLEVATDIEILASTDIRNIYIKLCRYDTIAWPSLSTIHSK